MRPASPCFAVALSMLLAAPAPANDTSAGWSVGGLIFLHDGRIAMESEDLVLGPEQVQVDYVFRNLTDAPVDTLVAFPLPGVGAPDDSIDRPPLAADPGGRFLDFVTEVEGRPVAMQVETRARLAGLEPAKTARRRQS